jgi:hypothetical protein
VLINRYDDTGSSRSWHLDGSRRHDDAVSESKPGIIRNYPQIFAHYVDFIPYFIALEVTDIDTITLDQVIRPGIAFIDVIGWNRSGSG